MSERSHFPLAKIKHFTTSCQILIRRKLAEEYHFPKQTGQVFLLFWVACPTLSPSPALISSSVISSCLNANSKGARAVFHSNRSFVIKEEGGGRKAPRRQALCTGSSRLLFETERMRSPVWPQLPGATPKPASTRTHSLTQVRPQSTSPISPKQYLSFWPAVGVTGWKKRRENKKERKQTENRAQRDVEAGSSPHKTTLVEREKRPAWRQHQHRFCSHCSAGNYDNNVFPRRPLSDLVSKHLPFLKSPPW